MLYCQSAAALMRVYPTWVATMDMRGGGATPDALRVFYANQCWVVPARTATKVTERRSFRAPDDTYQLARVEFDAPREHMEERFSREGEYQGKAKVTYTGGWTFTKALACSE